MSCSRLFRLSTTVLQLYMSQQDIKFLFHGVNYQVRHCNTDVKTLLHPAKSFQIKFMFLMKNFMEKYCPILSDRYVLPVWMGFLAKNILHYFVNISFLLLVEKYLCLMVIDINFYSHCTFCYNIGLPPSNPWKRVCVHVCVFEFVC